MITRDQIRIIDQVKDKKLISARVNSLQFKLKVALKSRREINTVKLDSD